MASSEGLVIFSDVLPHVLLHIVDRLSVKPREEEPQPKQSQFSHHSGEHSLVFGSVKKKGLHQCPWSKQKETRLGREVSKLARSQRTRLGASMGRRLGKQGAVH